MYGVILLFLVHLINSQPVTHNSTRLTTSSYIFGYDVAVDSQGSFQYVGDYWASATFGGPTLTTNNLVSNVWLAKYDAFFRYLSSAGLGNPSQSNTIRGVEFDSEDSMIIIGGTQGGLDFGGGAFASKGGWDIWIAKYYPIGTWQWASVYGDSADDTAFGLAVGPDDSIVYCGYFSGNVSFGGLVHPSVAGSRDMFVSKMSKSGTFQWSLSFGSSGPDYAIATAVDVNGNILAGGSYSGSDLVINGSTLPSFGDNDMLLIMLSPSGDILWFKAYGNTGSDQVYCVTFDSQGNVLIATNFFNTVDYGTGNLTTVSGSQDIAIVKYTSSGEAIWSQSFGSPGTEWVNTNALQIGLDDNIYFAGTYQTGFSAGGNTLASPPSNGVGVFMIKLDSNGNFTWSQEYTSTVTVSPFSGPMLVDTVNNKLLLSVSFSGTMSFGGPSVTAPAAAWSGLALVLLNENIPSPSPVATPSVGASSSPALASPTISSPSNSTSSSNVNYQRDILILILLPAGTAVVVAILIVAAMRCKTTPENARDEVEMEPSQHTVGIGFSGGGIRSASYACGAMTSLAQKLNTIDHIASVSGGGYFATALMVQMLEARKNDAASTSVDFKEATAAAVAKFKKDPGYMVSGVDCGQRALDILLLIALVLAQVVCALICVLPWAVPFALVVDSAFGRWMNKDWESTDCSHEASKWSFIGLLFALAGIWAVLKVLAIALELLAFNLRHLRKLLRVASTFTAFLGSVIVGAWMAVQLDELSDDVEDGTWLVAVLFFIFRMLFQGTSNVFDLEVGNHSLFFVLLLVYTKIVEWRVYKCQTFFIEYDAKLFDAALILSAGCILLSIFLSIVRGNLLHWFYSTSLRIKFHENRNTKLSEFNRPGFPTLHITATSNLWKSSPSSNPYNLYTFTQRSKGPVFSYVEPWDQVADQPSCWNWFRSRRSDNNNNPVPSNRVDIGDTMLADAMGYSAAAVAYAFGSMEFDNLRLTQGFAGIGLGGWTENLHDRSKWVFLFIEAVGPIGFAILSVMNYVEYWEFTGHHGLIVLALWCSDILLLIFAYLPRVWTSWHARHRNLAFGVELISEQVPENVYVSDGGHLENLALVPLLERKCKEIYLVDCEASNDCTAFSKALDLARQYLNCDFFVEDDPYADVDTATYRFALDCHTSQRRNPNANINHCLKIGVRFSSQEFGTIHYFKAKSYKEFDEHHAAYGICCSPSCCNCLSGISAHPYHATGNQFFTPDVFDYYYNLGLDNVNKGLAQITT